MGVRGPGDHPLLSQTGKRSALGSSTAVTVRPRGRSTGRQHGCNSRVRSHGSLEATRWGPWMIINNRSSGHTGLHAKSVAGSGSGSGGRGVLSAPAPSLRCPAQLSPRRRWPRPLRCETSRHRLPVRLPQTGTGHGPAGRTHRPGTRTALAGTAVAVQPRSPTLRVTRRVSLHRVAEGRGGSPRAL